MEGIKEKQKIGAIKYSEDFRRQVCEEYLRTGISKKALREKHGILYVGGIYVWLREFGYADIHGRGRYLEPAIISPLATKKTPRSSSGTDVSLQERIKELERLLEDEQLRSEAYSRMIDIAEKELKVPIRKKPDTR